MIIVGTYLNKQVEDNEKQNLENPQIHHMMAINKLMKKFSFESDTYFKSKENFSKNYCSIKAENLLQQFAQVQYQM